MMKEKPIIQKDLMIIGAGPAGLTAGIYAGRLKLDTLILENEIVGGQIRDAYLLENYPGFSSISGGELINKMQAQAEESGAVIDEFDSIESLILTDEHKIVETQTAVYHPKAVIIASGAKKRPLPIPEEKKFHSRGIHYCELCDGHMYEGKEIAVVGGGNSALLAVKLLSKYATKITIIQQFDNFNAEPKVQDEIFSNPKVEILWNTEVVSGFGSEHLEGIQVKNMTTGALQELNVSGVFVYIGYVPGTDLYKEMVTLDKYGNILADESTQTSVKGVFAAGDIRSKAFRQVTTAVSDGTVAALNAEKFIQAM